MISVKLILKKFYVLPVFVLCPIFIYAGFLDSGLDIFRAGPSVNFEILDPEISLGYHHELISKVYDGDSTYSSINQNNYTPAIILPEYLGTQFDGMFTQSNFDHFNVFQSADVSERSDFYREALQMSFLMVYSPVSVKTILEQSKGRDDFYFNICN